MPELRAAFSANLRRLLESEKSIAHVCRELSINRQQFNRYLSAATLPSTQNIRKIAGYFNVTENALFGKGEPLKAEESAVDTEPFLARLSETFGGECKLITDGRYFCYLPFPGGPVSKCMRGLLVVKRKGAQVQVSGLVSIAREGDKVRLGNISRLSGLLREHGGAIQLLAMFDDGTNDLVMMHFAPLQTGRNSFFAGSSMLLRRNNALSGRASISRAPDSAGLLSLVQKCGVISLDSSEIGPWVRAALSDDDGGAPPLLTPKSLAAIVSG